MLRLPPWRPFSEKTHGADPDRGAAKLAAASRKFESELLLSLFEKEADLFEARRSLGELMVLRDELFGAETPIAKLFSAMGVIIRSHLPFVNSVRRGEIDDWSVRLASHDRSLSQIRDLLFVRGSNGAGLSADECMDVFLEIVFEEQRRMKAADGKEADGHEVG